MGMKIFFTFSSSDGRNEDEDEDEGTTEEKALTAVATGSKLLWWKLRLPILLQVKMAFITGEQFVCSRNFSA